MITCALSKSIIGPAPKHGVLTLAIPTYNRLAELTVLVEMIIPQMQGDVLNKVEVIFNDNGSTDGTEDYLCTLAAQYPWVSYYRHAENQGIPRQFFFGPARARCPYVWNIGDDDGLKPNAIATVLNVLETQNVQFITINREVRDRYMEKINSPVMNYAPSRRYEKYQDLLGDYGIYQHGLWIGVVFARDPMNALDYGPYTVATKTANEGYGHIGAYMEAYKDKPAYYLADTIAIHRDQNFKNLNATYIRHYRMLTIDLMDVLHTAAERAGYPKDFIEHISGVKCVENYSTVYPQKMSDTVVENLFCALANGHRFDTEEWSKLSQWAKHWRTEHQACIGLAFETEQKLIKAEETLKAAQTKQTAIETDPLLSAAERAEKLAILLSEQQRTMALFQGYLHRLQVWGQALYTHGPSAIVAAAYSQPAVA